MQVTVKNLSPKDVYLRLNNGKYVNIPSRGSRPVDSARLEANLACDKLCKRGVIAVEKRQADKTAGAKVEAAIETGAKSEPTPEEGEGKSKKRTAPAKKKPPIS